MLWYLIKEPYFQRSIDRTYLAFYSLPNSREVITRSTANVWVVGQRVPKRDAASNGSISSPNPQDTGAGSGDSDDSFEPLTERAETLALTCTEIYLIAAKKDSTLVDIKGKLFFS